MSNPVLVWKQRYDSETYILNPHQNDPTNVLVNTQPLIISVQKTYEGHVSKKRNYTSRDVALLTNMFKELKFKSPLIWTDTEHGNQGGKLYTKASFLGALTELSREPEFTNQADMFVCVVLAHGGEGYFYLPNQGKNDEPPKVMLTEVLDIFKGGNCPGLILKPKILIAQTCDLDLKKVDKSLFHGGTGGSPITLQVPKEIDLFYYQSTISGQYMKYIKKKNREFYSDLGDVVDQDGDHPSTPLVYNLQKSVHELIEKEQSVNLDTLVIEVNRKIEEFIKSENWRIREGDNSWTDEDLKVPICINQLSKELDIKGFQN